MTGLYKKQRNFWGWIFCIPAIVSLLLFVVYPIAFSVLLSFTDVRYQVTSLKFKGFFNYQYLFTNSTTLFWPSLLNSLKFSLISTALQVSLGFLIAYLIYKMKGGLQTVFRVLIYVPVVLPAPVVSVMWKFIFAHENGLLDRVLLALGFHDLPAWLVTPGWSMAAVIVANTWWFIGTTIILYFVSMNSVPKDCLEGAKIDGVNRFQELIYFILPLTFSMTKVNLVMSLVGGIKNFTLFFLLTEGAGDSKVVGLIIFNTMYKNHNFSLAVTMSIVLSLILAVFVWFGNFYLSRREKQDD
ncbi:MAG: sugar ABC transporter permease [Candidatus Borkfalkiaceae bacterium]|nr:sugar ABC transporter permease [Christensenellaceae bacterium]